MTTWLRALCVAVAMLLSSAATADEREDRETARREFAAGQAADRRKAYAEAIEHYMRANDLVPHPFAMFNIAVDFEKLGKLREASTWYERYLDHSSTKEADRERVNQKLIELRNRPGQVAVVSNPDGARVIINGVPVGTTPYKTELKGGFYNVIVQKGNERDSKEITVEYGEPHNLQFAFSNAVQTVPAATTTTQKPVEIRRPPPPRGASGMLFVRGEPFGALVAVDGVPIGTLPMSIALEPGQHEVRITADGYSPFEQTVRIVAGGQAPVDARLSRALNNLGTPATGTSGIKVGYLVGGGGGVDVRGTGAIYMVELGARASKYDIAARVGRADEDVTIVDLLIRWTLTKTRLAPYIGGGYTFVENGGGYVAVGGLRLDIADGDRAGLSLMAESGYRFYTSSSSTTASEEAPEGSIVPIMASLLIRYR